MNKAADLMIENPTVVKSSLSGLETIKSLINSEAGVVFVAAKDSSHKMEMVTCSSILKALLNYHDIKNTKAENLSFKYYPTVNIDCDVDLLMPDLFNYGAIAVVSDSKEIEGVISIANISNALIKKYEDLERELDAIISFTSDELLVADAEGIVLRANSVFEENYQIKLPEIIGKKVEDLEKNKIFFPSVTKLVLDKKNAQTVLQSCKTGRKLLATGIPAFNDDGTIFRVVVNTRDVTKLNKLKHKLEETELLKNRYQQELMDLRQGFLSKSVIIASSPKMLEIMNTARKIAAVDSTVLISGESGSGKGVISRYIHNCSSRSDKPFTLVNCGAIPDNLLESELFGYTGGAFTGARREGKIGKLELANEGTVLLDEITEMPLSLQVKLLHVIQEGTICRIGGSREIKLNLRFIATTNRDIEKSVQEGNFREDLYFRLNVIPLEVPPLRERAGDIRPLTMQLVEQLSRRYGKYKYFSEEAYYYLEHYQWPGNIRELENLIERMMIVVDTEEISEEDLPRHITGKSTSIDAKALTHYSLQPLKKARDKLEKELLEEAMRQCRTTYEIAKVLEIDQSTVVRKMKRYKLNFAD